MTLFYVGLYGGEFFMKIIISIFIVLFGVVGNSSAVVAKLPDQSLIKIAANISMMCLSADIDGYIVQHPCSQEDNQKISMERVAGQDDIFRFKMGPENANCIEVIGETWGNGAKIKSNPC